ncbi:hypothetical protein H7827_12710 [Streptomyces sp. JH002]|uniref:hypothetical protein n=1 Tax=Streptomyces sp. JH002 TaxID=2763259 RepID=UPI003D807BF7
MVGRIASLAALLLAVCGCTGTGEAAEEDAGTRQARETVRQLPEVLAGAGSSLVATAMEMTSGGTRVTIRGEGGYDFVTRSGELRVTLPLEIPAGAVPPVTEVFTPGALYMKNRGAGVPADKWVRVDVTTLTDGNLVANGATDPLLAAELLRGVVSVRELPELELNGEWVRHLRGVTDLVVAAREASGPAGEQLVAALAGFADPVVPFDAYLGADGLPRKIRHQFSLGSERGLEGVDVASTVEFSGFGTPVTVSLPVPEDLYTGAVG